MRPVRAKALIINAFALAGRFAIFNPHTQGAALGYELIGLSARITDIWLHPSPTIWNQRKFTPKYKGLLLPSNSCPFALQKDPFCSPKGFVLQPKRTPFQNDSETQLSVGGVSVKTQRMRAESPMTSTAKGNALGEKGILNLTPCKGNSQWLNRVALTGRNVYWMLCTQSTALGKSIAKTNAPCKGKSVNYQCFCPYRAFGLYLSVHPGRCPGLCASAPSGRAA